MSFIFLGRGRNISCKTIVKRALLTLLTLGLFISAIPAQAEPRWSTYVNQVIGYSVTYPSYLRLRPWPKDKDPNSSEQWRSKVFESPDQEVSLVIEEHPEVEGKTLNDYFHQRMKDRHGGGTVDYSIMKENWFVVSGMNSLGYEFYEKFYLFPPTLPGETGHWCISFTFAYPHNARKNFDSIVSKIAHDFKPNLPGGQDH
jgi:hypothetical protein